MRCHISAYKSLAHIVFFSLYSLLVYFPPLDYYCLLMDDVTM